MDKNDNKDQNTGGQTSLSDLPSLYEKLEDAFLIGAAIEVYQTSGVHAELLKGHFNSVVAENVMKPEHIVPREGKYTFEEADRIVAFAKQNNMKVRFHTLVWHNQTPAWFFQDEQGNEMTPSKENKQLLLKRLKQFIRTVCERYKNDIESWDVVNEVIDPEQSDGIRQSKWFQLSGTDYIETAFHTAREVIGDNAKLFINDYNTNDPAKREHLYNLVKRLLARGVPIDGIGHQMHINLEWPSVATIAETMDMFGELGLDNKVTELDISVYSNSTDKMETIPDTLLVKQGNRYKEVFDVLRSKNDKVSQVVTWGIADDHTWKSTFPITRKDVPLLFDKHLRPKQAFWGIVDS